MEGSWSPLTDLLVVLCIFFLLGLIVYLMRQNQLKTARTKAMFGALPAGAVPGGRPAVVVNKRMYTWPDRIGYYVTFQTDGTAQTEVEVTSEWYSYLSLGERGQLAVDGNQFYGFTKAG